MTTTAYELALIINLISATMTLIFYALASTFLVGNISMLSIFITILFLDMMIWYIIKLINKKDKSEEEEEEETTDYKGDMGETAISSATEDEIDFSEEIIHE